MLSVLLIDTVIYGAIDYAMEKVHAKDIISFVVLDGIYEYFLKGWVESQAFDIFSLQRSTTKVYSARIATKTLVLGSLQYGSLKLILKKGNYIHELLKVFGAVVGDTAMMNWYWQESPAI